VNNGEAAVFATVDASPQDLGVASMSQEAPARGRGPAPGAAVPGGRGASDAVPARLDSFKAWPMKAAAFDLDRFRV